MFNSRRKKNRVNDDSGRIYLLNDRTSFDVREAYRSLRTNVMFSLAAGEEGKIIGITSSESGEGKSTNAFNLALSMAETGKKILFVDCDLRLSVTARRTGLTASPGLSNVLVGMASLEDCIQAYENSGLEVITAGNFPPNPAELLGSSRMEQLCQFFRKRYDYIIADLPPVGMVADAIIMSKFFDGVILVVKEGYSRSDRIRAMVHDLDFVGARILGFLYVGSEEKKRRRYDRHNRYGRYEKYGYEYYGYDGYEKGNSMARTEEPKIK